MTANEHADRRDIDWDVDECHICNDSTWLSPVLYEPIGVATDETENGQAYISSHPTPQDEYPVAVCSNCVSEAQQQLSDDRGVDFREVTFDEMTRYLTYRVYPDYIEKLYPEDVDRFEQLASD